MAEATPESHQGEGLSLEARRRVQGHSAWGRKGTLGLEERGSTPWNPGGGFGTCEEGERRPESQGKD